MHQHLMAKGLSKTAESLVQEANLTVGDKKSNNMGPFTYVAHCRVCTKLFKYFMFDV